MQTEPASESAAPKLWTAPFIKIMSANTLSSICSSMIIQALPLYVMELGSSEAVAGLIMGIYTIASLVCRPFFGNMVDTRGRQSVLIIGVIIILTTCFSFSLTSIVAVILFIRGVQGAGYSAFSTAAGTIVADVLPQNRLSEGIGYYGVSFNIASSFGPALMLFMRDHLGYKSIFFATGAISILTFLLGFTLKYERKSDKSVKATQNPSKKLTLDSVVEKTAIPGALVLILIMLPNGLIASFLVKYSETLGVGGIGLYFTFNAIAMILSRLFVGRICDRVGAQRALPPGLMLIFGGILLIAFARSLFIFIVAGMMLGFGYGIVNPTIQAFVMKSAPLHRRGAASATYYSSMDLGSGAGSILGGIMTQWIGFTTSFAIFSLFMVGAFAVFFTVLRKKINPNDHPQ